MAQIKTGYAQHLACRRITLHVLNGLEVGYVFGRPYERFTRTHVVSHSGMS